MQCSLHCADGASWALVSSLLTNNSAVTTSCLGTQSHSSTHVGTMGPLHNCSRFCSHWVGVAAKEKDSRGRASSASLVSNGVVQL